MSDAGLHFHVKNIEDCHAGAFACGAKSGRAGYMRLEWPRNWLCLADWFVDIGEQIRWIGGVEVACFGCVHDRATANRDKAVEVARVREFSTREKRSVGRLNFDRVIYLDVKSGIANCLYRRSDIFELSNPGVGI